MVGWGDAAVLVALANAGALIGVRYKVAAIVAASLLVVAFTMAALSLASALACITALQAGYLAGTAVTCHRST